METPLQRPLTEVKLLIDHDHHIWSEEAIFNVVYHNNIFENDTASCLSGEPLFRVQGRWSWSRRRQVLDGVKDHWLFDFRQHTLGIKKGWVVEGPDGKQLCSLRHDIHGRPNSSGAHSCVEADVWTQDGDYAQFQMCSFGSELQVTNKSVAEHDRVFATIHKVDVIDTPGTRGDPERSIWQARVAAGVDLSLVSQTCLYFFGAL